MLAGLITICGGIIAASNLIIARKPNAKDLIDKLTPYQGWIGIVMFFWGIWGMFGQLRLLSLIGSHPMLWILGLASASADLVVGFLLGFGLISKYTLGSSAAAQARGQQFRARLAPWQGTFGLLAIAMGVLYLIWIYVL
jgi:hypothetical protein